MVHKVDRCETVKCRMPRLIVQGFTVSLWGYAAPPIVAEAPLTALRS
jgi:hypothetical protein